MLLKIKQYIIYIYILVMYILYYLNVYTFWNNFVIRINYVYSNINKLYITSLLLLSVFRQNDI